jgi:HD-like signal output (HDOD) protein
LEELERIQAGRALPWKDLWTHSIASAIMTREILGATALHIDDDTDYLVGLLHNIGKVIMASAFPQELNQLMAEAHGTPFDVCAREREIIGWDHAQIGAYYLSRHNVSEEIVFAVQYHNAPETAPRHQLFAAAVQVADYVVRNASISGGFERVERIEDDAWTQLTGWRILFGDGETESLLARGAIANTLRRLPSMLEGLL